VSTHRSTRQEADVLSFRDRPKRNHKVGIVNLVVSTMAISGQYGKAGPGFGRIEINSPWAASRID
jgi:hypothetical protein